MSVRRLSAVPRFVYGLFAVGLVLQVGWHGSTPGPRAQAVALPDAPGVYRFLAADRRVLYVGKATSLRSRVNSYFRKRRGEDKALELVTN